MKNALKCQKNSNTKSRGARLKRHKSSKAVTCAGVETHQNSRDKTHTHTSIGQPLPTKCPTLCFTLCQRFLIELFGRPPAEPFIQHPNNSNSSIQALCVEEHEEALRFAQTGAKDWRRPCNLQKTMLCIHCYASKQRALKKKIKKTPRCQSPHLGALLCLHV